MPLGCCWGGVTRGYELSDCMVCCSNGRDWYGQRTRQYPAAREPAYRPPPRPLSRSSSRNIKNTLPELARGARGPLNPREPEGAGAAWTVFSPQTHPRRDEGATRARRRRQPDQQGGAREVGWGGAQAIRGGPERAGQQSAGRIFSSVGEA